MSYVTMYTDVTRWRHGSARDVNILLRMRCLRMMSILKCHWQTQVTWPLLLAHSRSTNDPMGFGVKA